MEKDELCIEMEIAMKARLIGESAAEWEIMSSTGTSGMKESGKITVFMAMGSSSAIMSSFSKENSSKVFATDWESTVMKTETFLKALSSETRNVVMEATTLLKEESSNHNSVLLPPKYPR